MTSVWRPAAASCWALSTRIDDVCMVCVSRVPCALPRNRVLREVVHIGRDVFLGRVVLRRQLEPAVYLRGLLREGKLPLEHLIGGIHDPVAVQIRIRVHIPDDEARREHVGEHHSGWLEVHGEFERIDGQGDEDGVTPPQTRAVGAPLQPKLGNAETKEWLSHRLAGGRLVVDRDRRFLVMASPKRDLVGLERGCGRRLLEDVRLGERARRARGLGEGRLNRGGRRAVGASGGDERQRDRKSTRLNSSHTVISYAVFCLKKKKKQRKVK